MKSLTIFPLYLFLIVSGALPLAASDPVPFVNQPIVPSSVTPGTGSFTITINGSGFVSGSVVEWNGSPLATAFVSSSQLSATVPASEIATPQTAIINVKNPGSPTLSNSAFLQVALPAEVVGFRSSKLLDLGFNEPSSVAVVDLNGDGNLDLAIASFGNGTVTILLGIGNGTFTIFNTFFTMYPLGIQSGDFNGDGKADLILTNSNSGTVAVFLGNGDGTFKAELDSATTPNPGGLALGDFNGDGKLDVITHDFIQPVLSVLLGKGDGTFASPLSFPAESASYGVSVADLNRDGKLDVMTSNDASASIAVSLGNGDGTFLPYTDYETATSPEDVIAADLNGDGIVDLAATGYSSLKSGFVSVLLGNGDGTFKNHVDYEIGHEPMRVTSGDFNGDAVTDLAALGFNNGGSGEALILLGVGDGTFVQSGSFPTATHSASQLAAGDFDGDGRLDFVMTSESQYYVSVLLQSNIGGAFLSPSGLDFGTQKVGTTSQPQTVTLTNNGTAALRISSVSISGDFVESNNCSKAQLAIGTSCTIQVEFRPTAIGNRKGELKIIDSANPSEQSLTVKGTGN